LIGKHYYANNYFPLPDDRWQVKLSNFGLKFLRNVQYEPHELLWEAPENLRSGDYTGSKPGDVYAFGIVSAEILNMKTPWETLDTKHSPEDIIYLLRKGGAHPLRPKLEPVAQDLSPAFVSQCFG
jgi:hypothetical protein